MKHKLAGQRGISTPNPGVITSPLLAPHPPWIHAEDQALQIGSLVKSLQRAHKVGTLVVMTTNSNDTANNATNNTANAPVFPGPDPYAPLKDLPTFELSSPDIKDGEKIADEFRAPSNVSPQLDWANLPEGTKSIAVTCFDPDAPTASGFWHWAVFNIPATEKGLPQGAGSEDGSKLPEGAIQLVGDSGMRGHYGANPPAQHAPHRYMYAVHAVDVEKLDVPEDATPTVLGFNLYFHSIARAIITPWWENVGE